MVSQCGADAWLKGLASGDQRRPMGSGSALEVLHVCAVQIHDYCTLLYRSVASVKSSIKAIRFTLLGKIPLSFNLLFKRLTLL